jgi:hypothetical protein
MFQHVLDPGEIRLVRVGWSLHIGDERCGATCGERSQGSWPTDAQNGLGVQIAFQLHAIRQVRRVLLVLVVGAVGYDHNFKLFCSSNGFRAELLQEEPDI